VEVGPSKADSCYPEEFRASTKTAAPEFLITGGQKFGDGDQFDRPNGTRTCPSW
jgi:hypothetical protein